MSSHDEYSSDEEDIFEASQKSDVYLGFVDAPIVEDEDPPTIEDTFIGGQPIWLHPESLPKEKSLTCDNCNKKMALLLQAFAPMDGKLYDRVIYIFGCKDSRQCSKKKGSIKAIRGIVKDQETIDKIRKENEEAQSHQLDEKLKAETQKKLHIELTKDLFGKKEESSSVANPFGGSNPFDKKNDNPFSGSASSPFGSNPFGSKTEEESKAKKPESYAEIASKNETKKTKAKKNTSDTDSPLPSYKGSFVYVETEKFKKVANDPELEKYKHLIDMDVNKDDESESTGSSNRRGSSSVLDPQTSKISNMLDDKYFEAFSNTVKHNPGQVLRYNLGGKPLLYNGKDEIAKKFLSQPPNIPSPGFNPSSERQFELQLMPKAIMDLEEINTKETIEISDILNGMSWGTIIVATDKEDYISEEEFDDNNVAYIEEWCGVQWEESV
ncbi:20S rRNA accumulation protein 4 [Spathaspora sp. JA1]|nr:20S rRNA accumulation protein 4 [Spathaspora sp. JA1]